MKKPAIAIAAVIALVAVGAIVYFVAIKEDAAPELSVADRPVNTAPLESGTDGTWTVASGSSAGYRATESLAGGLADQTVTGRTDQVTGSVEVSGSTVSATEPFTVDMASITTGNDRRDGQYNGRIMDTAQFPTATFELDGPVTLPSVPADGEEVTVTVPGQMTIRGVTRAESVPLTVKLNGDELLVDGTIAVTWSDYGVPSPSAAGIVSVEDSGSIELLLVLAKS